MVLSKSRPIRWKYPLHWGGGGERGGKSSLPTNTINDESTPLAPLRTRKIGALHDLAIASAVSCRCHCNGLLQGVEVPLVARDFALHPAASQGRERVVSVLQRVQIPSVARDFALYTAASQSRERVVVGRALASVSSITLL